MFPGFSEKTQDFLWGVRLNNERPWFEAHKQDYLDHVQTPCGRWGKRSMKNSPPPTKNCP